MTISRRELLAQLGAGAAVRVAIPELGRFRWWDPSEHSASSGDRGPILLDRNESAYGPSQKVIEAIRGGAEISHRYPRSVEELEEKLAQIHGVKREQVLLTCGSGEVLRMAAAAFLGPGKKLIQAVPTFEALGRHARKVGAEVVDVPLTNAMSHDLAAILRNADETTGLVYICNPNNPTGSLTPRNDIDDFLRKLPGSAHVLVDEAYHHYVGGSASYSSFLDHPAGDSRVIVARTFSKIYGMAGLRVGYAVAPPDIARRLAEERLPVSVNILGVLAAGVALDDQQHVRSIFERNRNERQEFQNQMHARMLRGVDSHANFILLNAERPVNEVLEFFAKKNILLGRRIPSMDRHVRVSLGTKEEMVEFWRVWDQFEPHHKM